MRKITRKTKEERMEEVLLKPTTVNDTKYFYFVCDKCKAAFFEEDTIFSLSTGGYVCPNVVKTFFRDKMCGERIYGGDSKCFNEYYKFV